MMKKITVIAAAIAAAASYNATAAGTLGTHATATAGTAEGARFTGAIVSDTAPVVWERANNSATRIALPVVNTETMAGDGTTASVSPPAGLAQGHAVFGIRSKSAYKTASWNVPGAAIRVDAIGGDGELADVTPTGGNNTFGGANMTLRTPIFDAGVQIGMADVPLHTIALRINTTETTRGLAGQAICGFGEHSSGDAIGGNMLPRLEYQHGPSSIVPAARVAVTAAGGRDSATVVREVQDAGATGIDGLGQSELDACRITSNTEANAGRIVSYDKVIFLRDAPITLTFYSAQTESRRYTIPLSFRVEFV